MPNPRQRSEKPQIADQLHTIPDDGIGGLGAELADDIAASRKPPPTAKAHADTARAKAGYSPDRAKKW